MRAESLSDNLLLAMIASNGALLAEPPLTMLFFGVLVILLPITTESFPPFCRPKPPVLDMMLFETILSSSLISAPLLPVPLTTQLDNFWRTPPALKAIPFLSQLSTVYNIVVTAILKPYAITVRVSDDDIFERRTIGSCTAKNTSYSISTTCCRRNRECFY